MQALGQNIDLFQFVPEYVHIFENRLSVLSNY